MKLTAQEQKILDIINAYERSKMMGIKKEDFVASYVGDQK